MSHFIVLAVIIIIIIIIITMHGDDVKRCQNTISTIDGYSYCVVDIEDLEQQQVANIFAQININIIKLLAHLKSNSYDKENNWRVKNLLNNYNPDNLMEISPFSPGNSTSYTVDKGSVLALCIKNNSDGKFVDMNILMFVVIHELAHLSVESVGHGAEFVDAFTFLLKEGINAGVYKYDNYYENPVYYCKMTINSTPLNS